MGSAASALTSSHTQLCSSRSPGAVFWGPVGLALAMCPSLNPSPARVAGKVWGGVNDIERPKTYFYQNRIQVFLPKERTVKNTKVNLCLIFISHSPKWEGRIVKQKRRDKQIDLQRVPLKHSTGNFIRTCLSENNPRLGEKPSERISGNSAWHSHRARNSVCSNEPDWKLTIHGTLGKALRKAFASLGNN